MKVMATFWVILCLRDYGYQKLSGEKLPFISSTVSGYTVCFNIRPGMGERGVSNLVFVFLMDSIKFRLTVIISS